jgi:hypothetical protein
MTSKTAEHKRKVEDNINETQTKIAKLDDELNKIDAVLSEPKDTSSTKKILKFEEFNIVQVFFSCKIIERDLDRTVLTRVFRTLQNVKDGLSKIKDYAQASVDKNSTDDLVFTELDEFSAIEAKINTIKKCLNYFNDNSSSDDMNRITDLRLKLEFICDNLTKLDPFGHFIRTRCLDQLNHLQDGKINRGYFEIHFISAAVKQKEVVVNALKEFMTQLWKSMTPTQQKEIY